MSMFKDIKSDASIQNETNRLGGNRIVQTGLYAGVIDLAYGVKSDGGAHGLAVQVKLEDGTSYKETLWVTSKTGANFYTDNKGENQYLPGYVNANAIAMLAGEAELSDLETEKKVINLYDFESKKDLPTNVEMVMGLLGKPILLGILHQIEDKTKKGADNQYHPTGETREVNTIDKVFRASDRMTVPELRAKETVAKFADAWSERNTGKTRNRAKGVAGTAGAPAAAGAKSGATGAAKPKSGLFTG